MAVIMTERSAGGRPTKAQAAARTEVLLDAARTFFSEKGFAGTTIDEVAATLGFSKHTVYRRYANKRVLLEAVVDRDVERFRAALEKAASVEAAPMDSLRLIARAYFAFSASPGYSALYLAIALEAGKSEHLQARLRTWSTAALVPLHKAVTAAAPDQGWDVTEAMQTVEVLIDLLDGAANRAKWADEPHRNLDQVFEERWTVFCRAYPRAD